MGPRDDSISELDNSLELLDLSLFVDMERLWQCQHVAVGLGHAAPIPTRPLVNLLSATEGDRSA